MEKPGRYLLRYGYIGTYFRASSKTYLRGGRQGLDPGSVQGALEIALQKLRIRDYPEVRQSSRTDGGVHALNAAAHVDLCPRYKWVGSFDTPQTTVLLNRWFKRNNVNIFVNQIRKVPDSFNARFCAVKRVYLFRFAFPKKDIDPVVCSLARPIEETNRCYFVKWHLDIEKIKEAAKLFPGYHDFESFKKSPTVENWKHCRRGLLSLEVNKGKPMVTSANTDVEELYDFWELKFIGRSYVHNMIRRIMGALEGVGNGRITCDDIKMMLQIPSRHSWHRKINPAPPHGLYLCDVVYNEKDLSMELDSPIERDNSMLTFMNEWQMLKSKA